MWRLARDRMLKLILHAKNESSRFYRPFLPVQISIVCGSSTTINSTCWETSEDLSLRPGGGGVLPYMGYIGTCRGIGYGF